MNYHLNVVNIKSDGCANTICNTLDEIDGVNDTVVNITNGAVIVNAHNGIRDVITATLLDLGYPEVNARFNNSFATKAKSIYSCVKGRLSLS